MPGAPPSAGATSRASHAPRAAAGTWRLRRSMPRKPGQDAPNMRRMLTWLGAGAAPLAMPWLARLHNTARRHTSARKLLGNTSTTPSGSCAVRSFNPWSVAGAGDSTGGAAPPAAASRDRSANRKPPDRSGPTPPPGPSGAGAILHSSRAHTFTFARLSPAELKRFKSTSSVWAAAPPPFARPLGGVEDCAASSASNCDQSESWAAALPPCTPFARRDPSSARGPPPKQTWGGSNQAHTCCFETQTAASAKVGGGRPLRRPPRVPAGGARGPAPNTHSCAQPWAVSGDSRLSTSNSDSSATTEAVPVGVVPTAARGRRNGASASLRGCSVVCVSSPP